MADQKEILSFRVPPDLKQQLEKAAADDQRSVSSLVVKALTDWLKTNANAAERKKR
jgi:predicted HicB family RNase H-like nuclease